MSDSDTHKRVLEIVNRTKQELAEFCNAALIVVSFDSGDEATLMVKNVGPVSHGVGLAHYAMREAEKSWDACEAEEV